jgi:hypothetical protein
LRTGRESFHRQRPRKPAKFVATVKEAVANSKGERTA